MSHAQVAGSGEIARGTAWVSAYWGYSAPKIVFDGSTYYTTGLWGETQETAKGIVYKHANGAWSPGAELAGIYQPAMLLLDPQSRLIVIYNRQNAPFVVMRAKAPGNCFDFETIAPPRDVANGYYLGAACRNDRVYVAYSAMPSYSMYFVELNLSSGAWSSPTLMSAGQIEIKPKTAWTYPILAPVSGGLHVAASSSPDGGDGNTYDKVWYLYYADGATEPTRRELVAQSPIGSNAFAMDMAVDAQHRVHILHMWNGYKYGPSLPPGSPEPGIYDSVRDDSGNWTHARIGAICIGGYWQTEDALQAIYQDRGAIVTRGWSADANQWTAQRTLLEGDKTPGFPGFMDVLSSNSGSKLPAGPAIVVSSVMPGTDKIPTYALWSILP